MRYCIEIYFPEDVVRCGNCPFATNTKKCTPLWREYGDPNEPMFDCPLKQIKTEGRLIDADRLKQVLEKNFGNLGGADVLRQLIDMAPTVVEPEVQK